MSQTRSCLIAVCALIRTEMAESGAGPRKPSKIDFQPSQTQMPAAQCVFDAISLGTVVSYETSPGHKPNDICILLHKHKTTVLILQH
jgi:hypothetical protein